MSSHVPQSPSKVNEPVGRLAFACLALFLEEQVMVHDSELVARAEVHEEQNDRKADDDSLGDS